MTRRVSKHGTTYTVGSSQGYAGWEPRVCCWCGEKIVKSRQSCGFRFDDLTGATYSWHTACGVGPNVPGTQQPLSTRSRVCEDCGRTFSNLWAHAEECTGPR